MKFFIKKITAVFLSAVFIISLCSAAYAATVNMDLYYDGVNHKYSAEEVKIIVEGKEITGLDVPPLIINERTMVPARAVFENLGCEIAWNESTQEVYVMHNTDIVTLKINSSTGIKNGETFEMDTPAKIVNDRTLIPVRAASEAIGCEVGWDDSTRTVTINEKKNENTDTPDSNTASGSGTIKNPDVDNTNSGNSNNTGNLNSSSSTNTAGAVINIKSVSVPASLSAEQKFIISADGAIESYNSFVLEDNRLVIDIDNANMQITNTDIKTTNSSVVSSVRSGQNQTEPYKITRVVFDLNALADYEVKLSSDKKSIEVSFGVTQVTNLNVSSRGSTDYINIYGDTDLSVETYMLTNPDRVVINVFNAVSLLDSVYEAENSTNFVQDISTEQTDSKTVQIVANVSRLVEAEVVKNNGYASVVITKSSLDNLSYNSSNHTLTLLNTDSLYDRGITETDNYLGGTYRITLNGDYSDVFGTGTIKCNDDYLSSIKVGLDSNNYTYFEANENSILAVKINSSMDSIAIKFVNPKEVYSKIIVLDAGHGKGDNGASGNGLFEKNVNLAIVQKLYELLEEDEAIKVYATRLDDSYPTNAARAQMANQIADLFVSIHQNSSTTADPKGTEVLYNVHSNEANAASSKLTSKIAAQIALTWVINALGTENRGIKERPDLIVLNQTTVPAILIETCFISNAEDAAKISNQQNVDKLAENLYKAVSAMLNDYDLR